MTDSPENQQGAPEERVSSNDPGQSQKVEKVFEPRRDVSLQDAFDKISDTVKVPDKKINTTLDTAWRRFNAYDNQSGDLKKRYIRYRQFIIVATLATTIAAVMEVQLPDSIFKFLLQVLLVALPLISAALLTFAARFEGGNAWVGFRVAAENIRRKIYEIRVKRALTLITLDDLEDLHSEVKKSTDSLEELGVTTPVYVDSIDEENPDDEKLVEPNYVDVPSMDDGYSPITMENYIKWRVYPQAEWYRRRAIRDYRLTRAYRALILFVGILAPILVFLELGVWVAVTVALSSSLVAYLALKQYEQNYGVYNNTARKLEDLVGDFRLKMETMKVVQKIQWIKQVENVLAGEREVWQMSVLQGQAATEETLNQLVNRNANALQIRPITIEDEDEEEKQPPPIEPSSTTTSSTGPAQG